MKNMEEWFELKIEIEGVKNSLRYGISNLGRIKSFQGSESGTIIKGSVIQGYRSLNLRLPQGRSLNKYIHKIVAEAFVNRPSEDHKFVIHLDYEKTNNHFENLRWVTKEQMVEHNSKNPNVVKKAKPKKARHHKLEENQVRLIKKMLKSNSTPLKMIARKFGITTNQLYNIRIGKSWGHVII